MDARNSNSLPRGGRISAETQIMLDKNRNLGRKFFFIFSTDVQCEILLFLFFVLLNTEVKSINLTSAKDSKNILA